MVLPWATVVWVLFWLGCGVLAGASVLPWASDALLKRSYARSREWWLELLENEEATQSDAAYEELCKITAKQHCYSFGSSAANRARCAALLAGLIATCVCVQVLSAAPAFVMVPLALCCFAAACAAVCDIQARVIPFECCVLAGVGGVVFQLLACGWQGVAVGAAIALVVLGVCLAVNRLYARRGASAVGAGDIKFMTALSLMCGPGTLVGAMACYCAAAFVSLAGLLTQKLQLKSGIPMAPFLAIWVVVGAGACLWK